MASLRLFCKRPASFQGFIARELSRKSIRPFSSLSALSSVSRQYHPSRRNLSTLPNESSASAAASAAAAAAATSSRMQEEIPSFRVMKIRYDGTIETVNLRTSELLKSANIYARDLFTLNLTSRQERRGRAIPVRRTMSAILPRRTKIVLSFGNVRAVVGLDYVFLFDAHMPAVMEFAKDLAAIYQSKDTQGEPNELVFLEHVLRDTVDAYNRRLKIFDPIVDSFLVKVANEVYSDTGVHQLVPLKDALQAFEIQVKQAMDCMTELLNNDDEMLELLLTEQAAADKQGVPVDFLRHEHVELLLGVYARQLSSILMEIHYLMGRLQSKQEFVALALSGYRNRMIRINVHLAIASLSLGIGTAVAGFFGMNVVNGFEESTTAFYYVIFGSGMAGMLVTAGSLNYLSGRAMQKRASQRLNEIETLTSALSDMCALDYTMKPTLERGTTLDKEEFRKTLKRARQTKKATKKEVDLLFETFDRRTDGYLTRKDFAQEDKVMLPEPSGEKSN